MVKLLGLALILRVGLGGPNLRLCVRLAGSLARRVWILLSHPAFRFGNTARTAVGVFWMEDTVILRLAGAVACVAEL